jgi:hypothetical protein
VAPLAAAVQGETRRDPRPGDEEEVARILLAQEYGLRTCGWV